ncbi:hypothetical protein [Campylobacter sputorum]|uniref:hypothetical protein n=1 Tax=Campylobacter sputorum TaxID=206 RepID=UPI000B77F6B5|nr:hypothetical protein [Campylobacter sputorum]ASM36877.1 hypothetical protein CSF_1010 [Campylobacter sputorum bv. faecalis CCUG 20703]
MKLGEYVIFINIFIIFIMLFFINKLLDKFDIKRRLIYYICIVIAIGLLISGLFFNIVFNLYGGETNGYAMFLSYIGAFLFVVLEVFVLFAILFFKFLRKWIKNEIK